MELNFKTSLDKQFTIGTFNGNDVIITFDYPTIEQADKLEALKYQVFGLANKINPKQEQDRTEFEVDLLKLKQYKRLYVKFTVKDWAGLPDKCKLVNNELDENQLAALTRSDEVLEKLYSIIQEEIELSYTDKKKL